MPRVKGGTVTRRRHKKIIKQADTEGDSTTRLLFEQILADEEEHHDTFTTLLGK